MTAKARKDKFLKEEAALSQTDAAIIFGCRPRDVNEFMKPSFYLNGNPKYRQADVLKVRDRMMEAASGRRERNTDMLRQAARRT